MEKGNTRVRHDVCAMRAKGATARPTSYHQQWMEGKQAEARMLGCWEARKRNGIEAATLWITFQYASTCSSFIKPVGEPLQWQLAVPSSEMPIKEPRILEPGPAKRHLSPHALQTGSRNAAKTLPTSAQLRLQFPFCHICLTKWKFMQLASLCPDPLLHSPLLVILAGVLVG